MKKLLFLCVSLFTLTLFYSSARGQYEASPNAVGESFEQVFDRFGTAYPLRHVGLSSIEPPQMTRGSSTINFQTCLAGDDFELFFERGSGFHTSDTDADFNNQTIGIDPTANQQIACEVFTQLSAFIHSGIDSTHATRVRIWFRSMENALDENDDNLLDNEAQVNGALAFASSFYSLNLDYSDSLNNVLDGLVWQTLQSGQDPYPTFAPGLAVTPNSLCPFFHGYIAFNFFNPDFANKWFNGLNLGINGSQFDLFSVLLHEATHCLGFASLVKSDGTAGFGGGYECISRYDKLIRDSTNTQFIFSPDDINCNWYNNELVLDSLDLAPDVVLNCAQAPIINALGIALSLYAPPFFEGGSSLSHISRNCMTGAVPCAAGMYPNFVMQEGIATGEIVRIYQPEERNILCQLGYNLDTFFGDASTLNECTYNDICNTIVVGGVNDGYLNGESTFTVLGDVVFSAPNAGDTIPGILDNDFNAVGFTCLTIVQGNGILTANYDGNGIADSLSYDPSVDGLNILSYIPVGSDGTLGNLTYVFIFATGANCPDIGCTMVSNGGFEVASSQGADCWARVFGFPIFTLGRNFIDNCTLACNVGNLNSRTVDLCTYTHLPPTEVHNSLDSINNNILCVVSNATSGNYRTQLLENYLGFPLINGQSYRLSFWAKVANSGTNGVFTGNVPIRFGTMESYLPNYSQFDYPTELGPWGIIVDPVQFIRDSLNTSIAEIASFLVPDNRPQTTSTTCTFTFDEINDDWHPFTFEFTFNDSIPHNTLAVWVDNTITPLPNQAGLQTTSVFLDDVSLTPTFMASIDLPQNVCDDQGLLLLQGTPSGGIFDGPGVITDTISGNIQYFFDQSLLPVGTTAVAIEYTVQTSFGCPATIVTDVIHIIGNNAPIISATVLTDATCVNSCDGSASINFSGGTGTLVQTLIPSYPLNALCGDENYLATVTDSLGCEANAQFYVANLGVSCCNIQLSIDSTHVSCDNFANGSASITATGGLGALSYLWTGPGETTTAEDPTELTEGMWTITVTDSAGCVAVDSMLIQNISLSLVTDSLQAACAGSANGAAWITVSGGSAPYTYSWSGPGGATSAVEDPTGIVAGNWNVLVTDGNGCERLAAIAVDTLVIDIVIDQLVEACANSATGGAFVTISGGLEPYTYAWTANLQPLLTTQDISGVMPGIWHLEVTDAMGCTSEIDVDIPELIWDITAITVINGNVTWSAPLYVNEVIKVNLGATLNITDTDIFFGSAGKIIVYAGGKLIVRNSTLTHACSNGHWKGILVYGNQTGPAYVSNPTVANGRVEMYGASNNFPNGHSEVSYALRGCQIGENGFTPSNHRGGTCYIEGTTFLNNLKQDIDINEYNNVPRELVVTNCDFIVDNNFVLQMTDPKRYSLFLHKRVNKLRVNDCNWKYNYSGTNYRGMQNKNAIHGEGTALIDSCTFEGYWTAIMLTPPSGIPFLGTLVAVRNCDFASYNGIDLTGYSANAILIQNNIFRDIESAQNPILNAALTAPRNWNGNAQCDPPTILELNNGTDDTYLPGYAVRLRSCAYYKVQENIIDQDFSNLPTEHILPDRMGVYIDNCGSNTIPFSANRVDNCTAALIYRNDNRDYDADSLAFGANFTCNEFNFNFDDVIIMSDDEDGNVDDGIAQILGNSFESPKNPMHVDPIDPVGDIRVDDHIFQALGLTGHNYYWNSDTAELDTALCENIKTFPVSSSIICLIDPPSGSNIIANLTSERNQLKVTVADITSEINEIKDGGNTQYLADQIVYTNYQNALQTYYSLIENSPNLSEEVLMLALDQYALPNPLLVEILSSNPQAAKSVDVMDKVNNRMIPFTEYQKQMIMNGMNLTSYLESLRFQKQQATCVSRRLLYEITNLIVEDTTITDKKTELLNLYTDEWVPSDVLFKMSLHLADNDFASAEDIVDQWPSNYNPSSQELQAMHDWVWMFAHSNILNDEDIPLSSENENYLQQICHSAISVIADGALAILEKRGLQQVEELLTIPAKGNVRNGRGNIGTALTPKFNLYPNPGSQFTLLTCSEALLNDLTVDVYDVTGRKVYHALWKMESTQLLLNTEDWNSGVYLIQILGKLTLELVYVKQ
jgi:hypothetical protein